jgi:epoxyqueuosine reductase
MIDSKLLSDLKISDYAYTEIAEAQSYNKFNEWTEKNWQGPLHYLTDHRKDLRKDIRKFYPEFNSALVFLFSYQAERNGIDHYLEEHPQYNKLKIASYALAYGGVDYHHELKKRLLEVGETLKLIFSGLDYQLTLDVHPVLERDLAYRSGLGWFGKNSMLISREVGSFVMIGSLLLNQKLPFPNKSVELDHCGSCRACVDICPTGAIDGSLRQIDAAKCISTFTIELFKEDSKVPPNYENVKHEIFGCDLCQDVCPWNKRLDSRSEYSSTSLFSPTDKQKKIFDFFLLKPKKQIEHELELLSNGEFRKLFAGTALERTGRKGLLKNLRAIG